MQIDETYNPRLLSDYRYYVGTEDYDKTSRNIFGHLIELGLREDMHVLDMGAGSLRVGRWLITFLQPGHYTAVEPEELMVRIGLRENLPSEIIEYKKPKFFHNHDFKADGHFDLGVAWNVFIHCGKEQFKQCLAGSDVQTWLLTASIDIEERIWPKNTNKESFSYRYASHVGWRYIQDDFLEICQSHGYSAEKVKYINDNTYIWRLEKVEV